MDIWQELEQQYGRTSYTQEQFEKAWELVKYGQHSELSIMRRTKLPRKSIQRMVGIKARVIAQGCFPEKLYWNDVSHLRALNTTKSK